MSRSFSSDIIDQVITSSDIVDIISQYVTLTKSGTSLKCCCPFHNEKTPSFVVTPDKQLYHCFGCGAGGNVVNFIMEIEKLNFIEAITYLAERANISLPQNNNFHETEEKNKRRLEQIHRDAAIFYYKQLRKDIQAQQYLYKRGIQQKTIKKFGIGYAPKKGNSLLSYMLSIDYSIDELIKSGLVVKRTTEFADRFRHRIIFPIQTVTDKVIGFGGRVLDNENFPKYLNSPETKLFIKGRQLYGLNYAKKNITKDQLVLVEGYMDVISLNQKGVLNVVATLGTALTREQGMLLKRYAKEIIISYDGDDAGQKAAEKAVDILQSCDLDTKVLLLPDKLDPDEYINNYGLEGYIDKKNTALDSIEYKILKLKEKYNTSTMDGRIHFTKDISKYLSTIENEIEVETYINKIVKDMEISKQAIKKEINNVNNSKNRNNIKANYSREKKLNTKNAYESTQEKVLKLFIKDSMYYHQCKHHFDIEFFSDGIYRLLAEYIINNLEKNEKIEPATFISTIEDEKIVKIASSIFTTHEDNEEVQDINSYLNTLKRFKLQNDLSKLQEKMIQTDITEEKNIIFYKIIDKKKQLENL